MEYSKYIVGIDLGTTNIAVTYVDMEDEKRETKVFKISQLCAPGEVDAKELLPSFCFFPDFKLVPEKSTNLPWANNEKHAVGIYARDFGSAMPNRFISSVKSWLCHVGVDRRKEILPWGSKIKDVQKSPLEITSYYLEHIKNAWDYKFSKTKDVYGNKCFLVDQQIIITVPASFDETARELTIEAAEKAGYKNIKLLEEPLAAFYSWLDNNQDTWKKELLPGNRTLVMDVGGGTCDFSIIEMNNDGVLSRTAAGNHLLLGGDNIDISIAHKIEKEWGKQLSHGEWLTLCQKAREAKEKLLGAELESTEVVLLSQGSSVIGNSRKYTVEKKDLIELLNNGFIPEITVNAPSPTLKTGLQTMGLPYVPEPALTKHLLQFLRYSYKVTQKINSDLAKQTSEVLCPDKILFNGGTMIPGVVRNQILDNLNSWFKDKKVTELQSKDLSLAVSYGASYFGRTKRGEGVRVKSGTALSYYLNVSDKKETNPQAGKFVCVMPRGIDENIEQITDKIFLLSANKKVQFPLYSSATRLGDKSGDILVDDSNELTFVSTMETALKFGKISEKKIKAEIQSLLTETGVLKIYLKSLESTHKWPLNFDTRLLTESLDESAAKVSNAVVVDQKHIDEACIAIADYFKSKNNNGNLVKTIENTLDLKKKMWPLQCLRKMADTLLNIPYDLQKTPNKEARWLNLCGYCMRPGFGDTEDGIRLKSIWNLWYKKMHSKNNPVVISEWWIFWRRIASGLKNGHQRMIYQELNKELYPKGKYLKHIKTGVQVKTEMWRCLGALELVPVQQKQEIARILLGQISKLEAYEYWTLARLGNRHLFHAQINYIVSADIVEKWLDKIIPAKTEKNAMKDKLFAISCLARKTDNRALNIDDEHLNNAFKYLKENNASLNSIEHLTTFKQDTVAEQGEIAGDSIPLGLTLDV